MAPPNQEWNHDLPPGDAPSSEELKQLIAPFESEVLSSFNRGNKEMGVPPIPTIVTYARPATPEEIEFFTKLSRKNHRYRIIKYGVALSIVILLGLLAYSLGAMLLVR